MVRGWAARAGVKKRVTCHTFRHTLATHLLKGRADIRHIQALLGHESLSTTERYTRVEVSDLKKVLERAHPRGR
jgi:site-specific recombinase XerD